MLQRGSGVSFTKKHWSNNDVGSPPSMQQQHKNGGTSCVCFIVYASRKQNRLKKWGGLYYLFNFSFNLFWFLKCDSSCGTVSCMWWIFFPLHFYCLHCPSYLDYMNRSGHLNLYSDVLLPIVILNGYVNCCKELHNFILMCSSLLNGWITYQLSLLIVAQF